MNTLKSLVLFAILWAVGGFIASRFTPWWLLPWVFSWIYVAIAAFCAAIAVCAVITIICVLACIAISIMCRVVLMITDSDKKGGE